jgi:hypothetical protein
MKVLAIDQGTTATATGLGTVHMAVRGAGVTALAPLSAPS